MSDLVEREYHLRQYVGIPRDVLLWMEDAAAALREARAERDALRGLLECWCMAYEDREANESDRLFRETKTALAKGEG